MARNRAFIRVFGPPGAGKTELIQRLLDANSDRRLGAIRSEIADPDEPPIREIRDDREELERFRQCGASSAAVVRYDPDQDASQRTWDTDVIGLDYNESLVIEGSFPFRFPPDLPVFVARPLSKGRTLVEEAKPENQTNADSDEPPDTGELERDLLELVTGGPGDSSVDLTEFRDRLLEHATTSSKYRIADEYEGIQSAKVVAINVRSEEERERGEALAEQVRDLRRDDELYEELLSPGGDRRRITIRVADLSDPQDSGVRDLVRRIAREFDRR